MFIFAKYTACMNPEVQLHWFFRKPSLAQRRAAGSRFRGVVPTASEALMLVPGRVWAGSQGRRLGLWE